MAEEQSGASEQCDIQDDEAAYERATWEAIDECRHLIPPYYPSVWIGMVSSGELPTPLGTC
jgi:hypothetical protein